MGCTVGDPGESLNVIGSFWRRLQPFSHDKDRIKAIAMNSNDTDTGQIDRGIIFFTAFFMVV